jgi:hypothetical protein
MNASIAMEVNDSSSLRWGLPYPAEQLSQRVARPSILLLGESLPPWAADAAVRLRQLAALPTVDPHGSRPMDVEDVIDALTFMSRVMRGGTLPPWIGRLASGGVQLTWRVGDVEVEAVFDRSRNEREIMVAVGDNNEWDAPIDEADALFASVVDRLSNAHHEHVASA